MCDMHLNMSNSKDCTASRFMSIQENDQAHYITSREGGPASKTNSLMGTHNFSIHSKRDSITFEFTLFSWPEKEVQTNTPA